MESQIIQKSKTYFVNYSIIDSKQFFCKIQSLLLDAFKKGWT